MALAYHDLQGGGRSKRDIDGGDELGLFSSIVSIRRNFPGLCCIREFFFLKKGDSQQLEEFVFFTRINSSRSLPDLACL
jgi:hypothetical protein